MAETSEISPFQRLVCSAAGKAHARATQVMALDNACAQIARQAREPIMAQIRLAWWRDGLTAETLKPEHNSPEMLVLRGCDRFDEARAGLVALIDGWEELILSDEGASRAMLEAYAKGRGGGLFAAMAPEHAQEAIAAGEVWALWDLAGHLSDNALAAEALALANERAGCVTISRLPRMLAMMAGVALSDVRKGRGAPPALTPSLYIHLLWIQLSGR